ncbi:hypothetical protein IAD21_05401 [Abditibacteriota bacterium]|nr:hypothetical protein IAD21_05401 [Abditibacteriota bacterium]
MKSLAKFLLQFAILGSVSITSIPMASTTSATSVLWGQSGEKWTPNGRLPDFSYAGYHRGEEPLPTVKQVRNIKDFGAVGDGVTDDTKAFQSAVNATKDGALYIPPGRYQITDFIRIHRSHVVLRGAGPDKTILWFPRGLDEIDPHENHTSTGSPASAHSFDGGFITLEGDYNAKPLANITELAQRGENTVAVNQSAGLKVGQWVLVMLQEDAAQSLKTYLYDDDPGDIKNGKQFDTKMLMRVVRLNGNRVQFDRPLRFETRASWQPQILSFAPTVTESGVENIGFDFPDMRYRGHFKENGANAVELRHVNNCWVRNIVVHNGDIGVNVVACGNTIDGVTLTASPNRGIAAEGVAQCTGHHGIQCKYAEDNLVTHFDIQASYCHDISVEHASGNVFVEGKGSNLNFDHHKDTPYENLYTDIDCGAGTRVWRCGGGASLGRQSAGWETFWNIRSARPVDPPAQGWGAGNMNFVGLNSKKPGVLDAKDLWFEPTPTQQLEPANLHQAQLHRRLNLIQATSKTR